MNPAAQTNTRIHRPDDVVKRLRAQHNDGGGHYEYVARHATTDDPPATEKPHWPRHALTEQIPAAKVQAALSLPAAETKRINVASLDIALPVPPRPVVPQPAEPVAPVTVGLLERVLRGLRKLVSK